MWHPKIDQQVTFLYTLDMGVSSKFYEEVVGLVLVLDQGGCRIYRVSEDAFLGVCERPQERPPDGVIFTFVTEDVDEWYQHLKEKGAEIEAVPVENPSFNIYHFFFKDPNGYVLEVQKFLDPVWPGKER